MQTIDVSPLANLDATPAERSAINDWLMAVEDRHRPAINALESRLFDRWNNDPEAQAIYNEIIAARELRVAETSEILFTLARRAHPVHG